MQNHLKGQTSPYLLQHVNNPVDWYPWGKEAFEKAKAEDKPIFLSIGYSTCHWCHVMAHESFEDAEIAEILNQYFVSIKVDKEERPDIDSIYMAVCQSLTGSGGWPTTIFLTPEQKPFFAGTYFPKSARYGQIGLKELLLAIHENWDSDRRNLLESAEEVVAFLRRERQNESNVEAGNLDVHLIELAVQQYKQTFDHDFGGFGRAPKFPTPHNLLFLLKYYEKSRDESVLKMVEKTLLQMCRGGMFDHIGGGFSRYSTDRYFLVPHFEKMLYDNALLILAYCKSYQITKNFIYRDVAERTAEYIMREMTATEGGFYSAQDADSEGVEGRYYLFEPSEIIGILGEEAGSEFNQYFDITEKGNFEGKSIPNLLQHDMEGVDTSNSVRKTNNFNQNNRSGSDPSTHIGESLPMVYEYRKKRYALHLDDKILTAWNGLMIGAMCHLYRITENETYLEAATRAHEFIQNSLCENDTLYVSYREGKRSGKGFLDDYANEIFALLALYEATLDKAYLETAKQFCEKVNFDFSDKEQGGFFLYGEENEQLILRPKETYDGAIFSANSAMAYNFVKLYHLTGESRFQEFAERQLLFMSGEAEQYPMSYAMFLMALSDYLDAPEKITIVVKDHQDLEKLPCKISLDTVVCVLDVPTREYPLVNDRTTYYVCQGRACQPPTNVL